MNLAAEWLEADGRGGFASGTVSGERTRCYHALLLTATTPPTGRVVLVNGIEAWAETDQGRTALTTQRYRPDVLYPDGWRNLLGFSHAPWPCWRYRLPGGELSQEILATESGTVLRWRYDGAGPCRLVLRLLLSGRDYHATHHENPNFDFAASVGGQSVSWRPYPSLPAITATGGFAYRHQPDWYRGFLYAEEQERGLDCVEDLASPGLLEWDLGAGPATLLLQAEAGTGDATAMIEAERRRRAARLPMDAAADQYVARRGDGLTLIAGFPWFTDWGRDTFIAMRGLMLTRGRLAEAGQILRAWAGALDGGMLPNRFADQGDLPEYNAVDASLWFVIVAAEYLGAVPADAAMLVPAMEAVLSGYEAGTRYGIACDADGLLRAGQRGVALTWMDARLGDWVVTPRIGKPVEVQALWINALHAGAAWSTSRAAAWAALERRAVAAFRAGFPDPATGGLFDVIDADGVAGAVDRSVRPNQIFAVGGLPLAVLAGDEARRVVDLVEARLLTPLGLRTLAPGEPGYAGRYQGGPSERDGAYHQGTAWPWLMGAFVQAWLRVRDETPAAKAEARSRFLAPLLRHLEEAGLGHVSEVVDGDAPYRPGGCPFQAWSMGELIRIQAMLEEEG